jgi:double-stranded uracil-DNA glycosylase
MPSHRVWEEWMGKRMETLEDLLREDLRAVCVGINPSPVSVDAGHYYQGRLGQRFYGRLRDAGLLADSFIEGLEDDSLFDVGVGFTDIVKRPTKRASALLPQEFEHGRSLLEQKLQTYKPRLIIFTFKKTAEVLLGSFSGAGLRPAALEGIDAFVMPGPYAPKTETAPLLAQLAQLIAT